MLENLPCWTRTLWTGHCRTHRSFSQPESSSAVSSAPLLRLLSLTWCRPSRRRPETNSPLVKLLRADNPIKLLTLFSPCWICCPRLYSCCPRSLWMNDTKLLLRDESPGREWQEGRWCQESPAEGTRTHFWGGNKKTCWLFRSSALPQTVWVISSITDSRQ